MRTALRRSCAAEIAAVDGLKAIASRAPKPRGWCSGGGALRETSAGPGCAPWWLVRPVPPRNRIVSGFRSENVVTAVGFPIATDSPDLPSR